MQANQLISKFERELKDRIEIKSTYKLSPEKVFLEAFKYYDFSKTDRVDFIVFKKVITVKLGISLFPDEQLKQIFQFYTGKDDYLVYRAFISEMFNVNVLLSTRTKPQSEKESRSFTNNKHDKVDDEATIRKLIEYIVFKLRKGPLYGFVKLYKDFKEFDTDNRRTLSLNEFVHCLKRNNLEINPEDRRNLWMFFNNTGDGLEYEKLMDCLCVNFKNERVTLTRAMFDRFDFMEANKININMLKELFNGRQHFDVKQGRQPMDQIQFQFESLVDMFVKVNNNQLVVDCNQFLRLFRMLSAHIESDINFKQLIDYCFRFNKIPRKNKSEYNGQGNQSYKGLDNDDLYSTHSELKLDDILSDIDQQLSKKGNLAFIRFYKVLKGNDYDRNSHLYLKDFIKCIKEARIQMDEKRIKKVYKAYSDDNIMMNYDILLQNLVPQFKDDRIDYIKELYQRLFEQERENRLSFQTVISAFNFRGHPDFKTGVKQDFEITNEFKTALADFLICFQSNHVDVSWYGFLRFFEFYGRNWSPGYLKNVTLHAFKTISKSQYLSSNNKQEESPFAKKKKNMKFYEEYSKTKENQNNMAQAYKQPGDVYQQNFNKKNQQADQYYIEENQGFGNYKKPIDHLQSRRNSTAKHDQSITNRFDQSEFDPKTPLSPDDGSVVSQSHYENSIRKLNNKLQHTLSSMGNITVSNAHIYIDQLTANIREMKDVTVILKTEFEMTDKSDQNGTVDYEIFSNILDKHGLLRNLSDDKLHMIFLKNIGNDKRLHVQTFCNDLRGQMSKEREDATIDLFERLTPRNKQFMTLSTLRLSFIPDSFVFGKYGGNSNKREMIATVIDLFSSINLVGKSKTENWFG